MPNLIPENNFYGHESEAYVRLLEHVVVCGLITRQGMSLATSSNSYFERLILSARRQNHICKLRFSKKVNGHDTVQEYYAITRDGLKYLKMHGYSDWHNYLPDVQDELKEEKDSANTAQKESKGSQKKSKGSQKNARKKAAAAQRKADDYRRQADTGDVYSFATSLGASASDFMACGKYGDLSQVMTCGRSVVTNQTGCGQLASISAGGGQQVAPPKTVAEVKENMYESWSLKGGRQNEILPADMYFFSSAELRLMMKDLKMGGTEEQKRKALFDVRSGRYVGILNTRKGSYLIYRAALSGFGWAKNAGKRDTKAYQIESSCLLPYCDVTTIDSVNGIILCDKVQTFVNIIDDRHGKRSKKRSAPSKIGEGLNRVFCVPITIKGCNLFRKWMLEMSEDERTAYLNRYARDDYGLTIDPVKSKQAENVFSQFPLYWYQDDEPVFDLTSMDAQKIEAIYRALKKSMDANVRRKIGFIFFPSQTVYYRALFSNVCMADAFEIQEPAPLP